ncbi:hypothetical protein [Streptomyces sp. NPDC031705]|uniref:hypothetical protein n=1 Tax=Streptomyces sp. NPDC031705 TaxID=3155729 RepID=UPI003407E419
MHKNCRAQAAAQQLGGVPCVQGVDDGGVRAGGAATKLRASIPRDGIREPLLLGVRATDRLTFVFEGHHRAVIALELGVRSFPFRWFWDPDVKVVEHEPFPHHALGPDGQAWLCHQEARS